MKKKCYIEWRCRPYGAYPNINIRTTTKISLLWSYMSIAAKETTSNEIIAEMVRTKVRP